MLLALVRVPVPFLCKAVPPIGIRTGLSGLYAAHIILEKLQFDVFRLYIILLLTLIKGMVQLVRSKSHLKFSYLQCPCSNNGTQNFCCQCTMQKCEKIAQSWNVQFRFVPPCTCMMVVCLATAWYSTEYVGQVLRGCERLEKCHTDIYIAWVCA